MCRTGGSWCKKMSTVKFPKVRVHTFHQKNHFQCIMINIFLFTSLQVVQIFYIYFHSLDICFHCYWWVFLTICITPSEAASGILQTTMLHFALSGSTLWVNYHVWYWDTYRQDYTCHIFSVIRAWTNMLSIQISRLDHSLTSQVELTGYYLDFSLHHLYEPHCIQMREQLINHRNEPGWASLDTKHRDPALQHCCFSLFRFSYIALHNQT